MNIAMGTVSEAEQTSDAQQSIPGRSGKRARRADGGGAETKDLGPLSDEERAIIRAVRDLRAQEKAMTKPRPELLVHGYISFVEAAKLLGVTAEQLKRGVAVMGGRLPTVEGGRVPLSEVRRLATRMIQERLGVLSYPVEQMVRPKAARRHAFAPFADDHWGFDADGVAKELGISKAAAKRLMGRDGPMFCWRTSRGSSWVSIEELEAYRRMYMPNAPIPADEETIPADQKTQFRLLR